ncbi:MAG: ABC transporter permease subunit [Planctomycetes bacterium]|nr:ABC transporter permease subunit [Planctomycetota bacterium]
MIGRSTFVVGDSSGAVHAWFRIKPEDADSGDGSVLVAAHELVPSGGPAVTCLSPSSRSRLLVTGFADGRVTLHHVTSGQLLGETKLPDGRAPELLVLRPKEDGLLALAGGELFAWTMDKHHPEASFAALFGPVWYESYEKPDHVWQSSSGTDDFEPKLGLVPLVFGTVKATFYSMLFGAPIALLAALFTSEFLGRRARTPVKSTIEMMASLPSVVLGFLAAIVIAPFVQAMLPAVLAGLVAIPFCVLLGAYLWQLLPGPVAVRAAGLPRMGAMLLALLCGVLLADVLGGPVQDLLFAGDVVLWLDGQRGSAWGGWMILVLPVAALASALLLGRGLGAAFLARVRGWSRRACALADLTRFVFGALLTVGLALAVSHALDAMGFDARGGMLGTYEQRNALVVGFIMGFAIIPIIYTLADDALTSVPDHLRLASLGAGATPWQTAMRVVVPTAMSGLFSALMIGLGRAVGETMIVLMATGNTPVRDWNVFNGFRTLSANIAVELPEAVQGSTHYRTLFLAALVLFGMTFLLNTLAETVRQRFRRRAWQL